MSDPVRPSARDIRVVRPFPPTPTPIIARDSANIVFHKIRAILIGDALYTGIFYVLSSNTVRATGPSFRIIRDYFPGGLVSFGYGMLLVAAFLIAGYIWTGLRIAGNVVGVFVYVLFATALLFTGAAGAGPAHLFALAGIHMIGATRKRGTAARQLH
jgi:hypothetical protein